MLQLNRAKFSANGGCGYVLKPQCMCQGEGLRLGDGGAPMILDTGMVGKQNRGEGQSETELPGHWRGTCLLGCVCVCSEFYAKDP